MFTTMSNYQSGCVTDKGGSMHQFSPQMSSEAQTDVDGKLSVPSAARETI
ncbi:MAG: hypothetical protein ABIL22_01130 [candidate division WOR-3 bacterium]